MQPRSWTRRPTSWPPIWPNRSRAGRSPHLDHTRRVADPFHVVRVANRCVDQVRRRVQDETLGHLGLRVVDPNDELLGAGLAKDQSATSTSLSALQTPRSCWTRRSPAVPPTRSPRSATSAQPCSHGAARSSPTTTPADPTAPTEGLNLCLKKVRHRGHGFRSFDNYRLRVLLHAGGITWPDRPPPPRIRTRSPHSDA